LPKLKPDPRRTRGRPTLGPTVRNKRLTIKVSQEELLALNAVALAHNYRTTELTRAALTEYIARRFGATWPGVG
jgi:hypothetical protein